MINKSFLVFLAFLFSVSAFSQHGRSGGMISGRVISTVEKEVVDFATVYLKGTNRGATTDEKGLYHLKAAAGDYTLVVSAIGYTTVEKKVTLKAGERIRVNVTIAPQVARFRSSPAVSSRHGIFILSVFHQSIKSNVIIGIFFCNSPLASAKSVFSLGGIAAASLRNPSNTLLSLPNTPLLIHSSAESVCVSSAPK